MFSWPILRAGLAIEIKTTFYFTENIGVKGVFHGGDRDLSQRTDALNAGVVDKNVYLAELIYNIRQDFVHALLRPNIKLLHEQPRILLKISHLTP